jgi:hypothetical protein
VLAWHDHGCPAVVYTDAVAIDETGKDLRLAKSDPFNRERIRAVRNPIRQPSAFLGRKEVAAINFIDEELHYVMDYDLWYRLSRENSLIYIPGKPWSAMRMHAQAKTSAMKPAISAEFAEVLTRRLVEDGIAEDSAYYRKILGERQFRSAIKLARSGRRWYAFSTLLKAVRRAPLYVLKQPKKLLMEFSARMVVGESPLRIRSLAKR